MQVISNGIDSDNFSPDKETGLEMRKALGLKNDEVAFLYVARVDPMKGHDHLSCCRKTLPKI